MPGSDRPYIWLTFLCLAEIGTMQVFMNYPAILPLVKEEWHLTASQAGTIFSAYWVGYLGSVLFLTSLTDTLSPKRIYSLSALWAMIANLGFAWWAQDFFSAFVFRALTGIGLAGTYAPGMKLVAERFSEETRGLAMGIYTSCFSLGASLSLFLTGVLTPHLSWRGAFLVTSAGPLLGALVGLLILKDRPSATPRPTRIGPVRVLRNPQALLVITAYTGHSWELFGLRAWVVAFLAACLLQTGISLTSATDLASRYASAVLLLGAGASLFGGWRSDRWGRGRIILLASLLSSPLTLLLGWTYSLPFPLVLGLVGLLGIAIMLDSSTLSTAVTEVADPQYVGSTLALHSFSGFLAAAISPALFGTILDLAGSPTSRWSSLTGWGLAFTSLGLGALVAPLAIYRLGRSQKLPPSFFPTHRMKSLGQEADGMTETKDTHRPASRPHTDRPRDAQIDEADSLSD
ncbi:MAG: MFS transporter [Candidatus Methylomirabilales bacterium]